MECVIPSHFLLPGLLSLFFFFPLPLLHKPTNQAKPYPDPFFPLPTFRRAHFSNHHTQLIYFFTAIAQYLPHLSSHRSVPATPGKPLPSKRIKNLPQKTSREIEILLREEVFFKSEGVSGPFSHPGAGAVGRMTVGPLSCACCECGDCCARDGGDGRGGGWGGCFGISRVSDAVSHVCTRPAVFASIWHSRVEGRGWGVELWFVGLSMMAWRWCGDGVVWGSL